MKHMIKQHIILTNGRSGSNFIANTLNMHPEVVNVGEVLGEWTQPYKWYSKFSWLGISVETYINLIYNNFFVYYVAQFLSLFYHARKGKPVKFKLRRDIQSFGIKDFSFLIQKRKLDNWLINTNAIKIIYLYRENILKRYLSLVAMKQTGIVKSESSKNKRLIYVDTDNMLAELDVYEKQLDYEKLLISKISPDRIIKLRYEDYFLNSDEASRYNQQIFNFLGVNPIPLKSNHKKLNADKLDELIDNYEEVKGVLYGTHYYKYLEL